MPLTLRRGRQCLHEGCRNPATRLTGRILAKCTQFGVPSRGATPATRQPPEKGEELTHEAVELAQQLPVRPNTATVLRDSTMLR